MSDTVSLGLAYQSRMYMSEFDDYSDLFAEDGDFDIPSSIKVGLSFMASEQLRVNFDIEHTAFGEVDSIANPMANMLQCGSPALPPAFPFGGSDNESCLGGDNGPGIAAAERSKIFDKFYRGRGGGSSGEAGAGLGLAISRELVHVAEAVAVAVHTVRAPCRG
mgnify:CR=1 FL=1